MTRLKVAALMLLVWACAACGGAAKPTLEKVPGEPGGLLAINGHKLYIDCEGSGTPTVLLEAGLGGDHRVWDFVQPKLVKMTRRHG